MTYPTLEEEVELMKQGHLLVSGSDEAGRGAWAGPVVAASVVLDLERGEQLLKALDGVNDSKLLTSKKRDYFFEILKANCINIGVGIVDNDFIDREGIVLATKNAFFESFRKLECKVSFGLLDAVGFKDFPVPYKSIIKGDAKVLSIASASIIAKVTRDRIMKELHLKYPEYDFASHKGYGTKKHMDMIKQFGVCTIHRKSYAPIRRVLPK